MQPLTVPKKWEGIYPNNTFDWKSIFQIPYIVARETYLHSFQYKLLNRYLACRSNLFKWNKAPNPLCQDCLIEETIEHLLYHCPILQHFWTSLFDWLEVIFGIRINLTVMEIMFGISDENEDDILFVFNFCILYAKYYIYNCKVNNVVCYFPCFKQTLITRLEVERSIAISNNKLQEFVKRWNNILDCKKVIV